MVRRHQIRIVIAAPWDRCCSRAQVAHRRPHCRSDATRDGSCRSRHEDPAPALPQRASTARCTLAGKLRKGGFIVAAYAMTPRPDGRRALQARWSGPPAETASSMLRRRAYLRWHSPRTRMAPSTSIRLCGSIEADAVGEAAVAARIIGEDDRDTSLRRGVRRSRTQARARSAVAAMRSSTGRKTVGAKPASDSPRSLKAMAWAKMRPSTSGSTTCMARSRGNRPRVELSQLACEMPAWATCRIGHPDADNTPASSLAVAVANAVALMMISGGCAANAARRKAAERSSLRLVT